MLTVVGSLDREAPYFEGARGVGLPVFDFDAADGTAALLCEDGRVDNPSFLTVYLASRHPKPQRWLMPNRFGSVRTELPF